MKRLTAFAVLFLPLPVWGLDQPTTGYSATVELPGFSSTTVSAPAPSAQEFLDYENLTIHAVKLEGLKNARESSIRSQIKTRASEVFDPVQAKADLKRLMGLGIFSSADLTISTVSVKNLTKLGVTFIVVERPKIRKVFIVGNKAVGKGAIRDILSPASRQDEQKKEAYGQQKGFRSGDFRTEIESGAYLDEAKLSSVLAQIRAKYEEKAVFGSTIESEIKSIENNKVEITIRIQEGKRGRIGVINISGFSSYPEKKIRKTLKIKPGKPYNLKKIQKGLIKLNTLYKESGWIDFKVSVSSRTMDAAQALAPKVKIGPKEIPLELSYRGSEGNRHFLLSHRFEGNQEISTEQLHKLANLPTNKILQDSRLREAEANILDAYRNIGHLFASIELEKNWQEGARPGLDLVLRISERQKVYIGTVYIEGLAKTKEHVIRREVLLKEGDLFRSKKLYRSQEKIFNLGFIEDIQVDYEGTPNPNYVDLIFDVKEGRPGMLTAGAGFSSVDGVVGQVAIQHMNVFGRAQKIGLSTEFGKRRSSYDLSWTTPWTFDRPMSTTFGLFNTNRSLQFSSSSTGFKRRTQGGSVFLAPRFEEDRWILGFGYTLQEDRIYDVLDIYRDQIPAAKTLRSSVETRVTYDTRDYYLDPKKGTEQTVSNVLAGGPLGGDVHIVKPTGKHAVHIPTFTLGTRHTFVLSSSLRWGVVEEYQHGRYGSVPVSDRFFVGGAETVRGYTYTGQIGPIAGGKAYGVGNIEYKIPILMERRLTIIQFALFADFGGAWNGARDVNLNFGRNENNLKAGIGFGIRFKTPAFPVRLDWGWGLHHNPGEAINQFYFTIGSIL